MKVSKKRIEFGAETKMAQQGGRRCSDCRVRTGNLHRPGCAGEECPQCGKAVVGCCCDALSSYDAEKIIMGLYGQFESLESALQAAGEEGCPTGGNSSYLQHAIMKYIFNSVPESARKELEEAFHLRFPGLVPLLQDEEGRGYYTAEQLAEALGIPLDEVHERIDAMVTSGQVIESSEGRRMRKVH